MGRERQCRGGSLEADVLKWKATGGGTDRDGNPVTKPTSLSSAEVIDGLCQRYGSLPSEVLKEDASLLKMLYIVDLGKTEQT